MHAREAEGIIAHFDFAVVERRIELAGNFANAEAGADRLEAARRIDLAVVDMEAFRHTAFEHRDLEGVFERREFFIPIKLGVRHQSREVVDERGQASALVSFRRFRIWQLRAVKNVRLPNLMGRFGFLTGRSVFLWGGGKKLRRRFIERREQGDAAFLPAKI